MLLLMRRFVMSMVIIWCWSFIGPCDGSLMKVTSAALERPVVDYVNNSFGHVHKFLAQRISRSDHFHYIQLILETYTEVDCQKLIVDISIDELLSNTYRPTFVSLRVNGCEFYRLGNFSLFYARNISGPFTEFVMDKSKDKLIFPIGVYEAQNIIVNTDAIPDGFPFQNGRVNMKFTLEKSVIGTAHVDLILKMLPKRNSRNPKSPK